MISGVKHGSHSRRFMAITPAFAIRMGTDNDNLLAEACNLFYCFFLRFVISYYLRKRCNISAPVYNSNGFAFSVLWIVLMVLLDFRDFFFFHKIISQKRYRYRAPGNPDRAIILFMYPFIVLNKNT